MSSINNMKVPVAGSVFECVLPVRWGDLDALVHVNNTVYFRYAEEARAKLYKQAGFPVPGPRAAVLVHASLDFLKPLLYPSVVTVSLVFVRFGTSSMEYDVLIARQGEPDVLYAKGKNITVNTDGATGMPSAWTADELAGYARCFKLKP